MCRDRTADVTYCADVTLFSARDVRLTTMIAAFSPQISCVLIFNCYLASFSDVRVDE